MFDKVKAMKRTLMKKPKLEEPTDESILVVSTFGTDKKLVKVLKRIENTSNNITFRYAKKTASSLKNTLVKSKNASLGQPKGRTMPCVVANCMTCGMVSQRDHIVGPNDKTIDTARAQCNTRSVIYHASCRYCPKCYVGKTIQPLNTRINGHRNKFYDLLRYNGDKLDLDDDDYALGMHLYFHHGLRDRGGFNGGFSLTALECCNPQSIDLKEHLWIQRLKCIKPYGLNSHDPFGFPTVL